MMEKTPKACFLLIPPALMMGAGFCLADPLSINVTASLKTAYDDNITYSSVHSISDSVTSLEAGLELNQRSRTRQLSLKTDVIEEIFAQHSNFDNTAEDLNLDYKQDFSRHDHLELTDLLEHTYQPTTFEEAFGRTAGRYSTLTNQTGISLVHEYNPHLSQEVHYKDIISYFSHNGPTDSMLFVGGTKLSYAVNSATILTQSYDYMRRLFSNGPSATINALLSSVRRYFTPQFYLDLGVGPDIIKNYAGKNFTMPHYYLGLTDQITQKSSVKFTYEKDDSGDIWNKDLLNSWRTTLYFSQKFSPRLLATLGVFYGQGRYNVLGVNEKFQGAQTSLDFKLTKKTQLSLGYTFSDALSKNPNFAYRRNYVYVSVNITF